MLAGTADRGDALGGVSVVTVTFWFGAELNPDAGQVWIRVAEEAIGRMPEKTPGDRGRRLVDALIVWITPDRQLEPGVNPFQVRVSDADRPTPRSRPPTPRTPAGRTSGALCRLDAWLADRRLERHSPRLETVRLILRQQQAGPPPVCPPVAGVRPELARIAVPAPTLSAYDALVEGPC